ncbi:MAG: hypothetical protein ACLRP3_10390 [Escherichia sp.]
MGVALYSDKHTDRVLGGAIVGPQASELINEIALAMTFSALARILPVRSMRIRH